MFFSKIGAKNSRKNHNVKIKCISKIFWKFYFQLDKHCKICNLLTKFPLRGIFTEN